jgi:ornithine cyclodeaminase
MRVLSLDEVRSNLEMSEVVGAMREAFLALHQGRITAPDEFVMHHHFSGDIHGKGAHVHGSPWIVFKLATASFSVAGNHGCMLGIDARTGQVGVLINDGGWLTEVRTAAAVALSVDMFAAPNAQSLAIVGSGVQAGFQLDAVKSVRRFADIRVASRDFARAQAFADRHEFVTAHVSVGDAIDGADVVLFATSSSEPVLLSMPKVGAHVTSSGVDMVGKCEIAAELIDKFDLVAVDDIGLARRVGILQTASGVVPNVVTLGAAIDRCTVNQHRSDRRTLVGLSGVGTQDTQIFDLVMRKVFVR